MSTGVPHPLNSIADRIADLEARALCANALVWLPGESISGHWEAAGEDWTIGPEPDPVAFADALAKQLRARP